MSTTRTRRRLALGLAVAALATLGAIAPAGAAKPPRAVVTGDGEWFTHPVGWYEVVLGTGEVQIGKRTFTGDLAANVQPDDRSMPAAGSCEPGSGLVVIDGDDVDVRLVSIGDVCAHHPHEPTSVVVYSFTGNASTEVTGARKMQLRSGFLDIRMAQDGRATVFATAA